MVLILGWDCAHKSLAWSLLDIDFGKLTQVAKILSLITRALTAAVSRLKSHLASAIDLMSLAVEAARAAVTVLRSTIHIIDHAVVNVLGDKKLKDTAMPERSAAIIAYIESCPVNKLRLATILGAAKIDNKALRVVIEDQPQNMAAYAFSKKQKHTTHNSVSNAKSREVSVQLAAYYSDYDVRLIRPSLKNKLSFGGITLRSIVADRLKVNIATLGKLTPTWADRKKHAKKLMTELNSACQLALPKTTLKSADIADSALQCIYLAMSEQAPRVLAAHIQYNKAHLPLFRSHMSSVADEQQAVGNGDIMVAAAMTSC